MGLRTMLGLKKRKSRTATPTEQAPPWPNHVVDAGRDAPVLAVIGDFSHFSGSTLAAVLKGHWNMVPAETDKWLEANAFIKWAPWSDYVLPYALRGQVPGIIINDTHFNCDKANVQAHAHKALGYDQSIDPMVHVGSCVMKSRRNAAHDGRVIDCPVGEVDPNYVYEVLVDNRHGEAEINDLRLVMIMGELPVAYIKYRPLATRFGNLNSRVVLTTPEAILSADELIRCQAFANSIGMEYGELDILRDNGSNRIFIVDANNTPCGPPPQLSDADREETLRKQLDAITQTFVKHCQAKCFSPG